MVELKKYHNIYVPLVDTIELSGPEILKEFEAKSTKDKDHKNLLVIPIEVIDELERSKLNGSYGAEDFLKAIDDNKINFKESVSEYNIYNMMDRLDVAVINQDNLINNYKDIVSKIGSFWEQVDENDAWGRQPRFISNNVASRLRIKNKGFAVDKPEFLLESAEIVKRGIIPASNKFANKIFSSKHGELSLEEAIDLLDPENGVLYPNQFIKIQGTQDAYARVIGDLVKTSSGKIIGYDNAKVKLLNNHEYNKKIKIGSVSKSDILGISALDMEQYLSFQYGLMNDDIELFFLTGSAGSGKTLLSYVAAIDQVLWYDSGLAKQRGYGLDSKGNQKRSKFREIVLLKPNNLIGKNRDIGFLPGNLFEKLKPHLEPYIDAHKESDLGKQFRFEELLTHPRWDNEYFKQRSDDIKKIKINNEAYLPGDTEAFHMTYSGFMRGRSFKDTLVLIDEAPNFTPYEMKTICERIGPGSKMVIMGDPYQVDNADCSRDMNGLTHALKHYLPKPYSALIHLPKNYRSQLSEDSLTWKVYSH